MASVASLAPLDGSYMQRRLAACSVGASVSPAASGAFRIGAWLSQVSSELSELTCLTHIACIGGGSASTMLTTARWVSTHPQHLYLAERRTGPNDAYQSPPLFAAWMACVRQLDPSSRDALLLGLEPHASVLCRQLSLLSPQEIITYPMYASSSSTIEWGSPLLAMPVPQRRGDLMWRLWAVLLNKHREAALSHAHYSLIQPKTLRAGAGSRLSDVPAYGPVFGLYSRVATVDSIAPERVLLLLSLLREYGIERDNCGNSFAWHLVNSAHPPTAHQIETLRYWAVHGHLDTELAIDERPDRASSMQRTLVQDARARVDEAQQMAAGHPPYADSWLRPRQAILDILQLRVKERESRSN